jgi:phosphatidylglycerophosphate synthase
MTTTHAPAVPHPPAFREAQRDLAGLSTGLEKRVLQWLAPRLPARVTPDHLTALGLLAMALGGIGYAAAGRHRWLLLLVNLALLLNWLGDSLDGTLARHRNKLRPRYGFYVDHVVDAIGALLLLGGLSLSGLVSPGVAAVLLIVYYLFAVNMYLATHTLGRFKMSYGVIGGTELRILLGLLNLLVFWWPVVPTPAGPILLFDLAGVLAAAGLGATLAKSIFAVTRELYELERV